MSKRTTPTNEAGSVEFTLGQAIMMREAVGKLFTQMNDFTAMLVAGQDTSGTQSEINAIIAEIKSRHELLG